MKKFIDALFQGGADVFPGQFARANQPGDWQDVVVNFPLAFPDDNVHVIVTPTNFQPDGQDHTVVPIPVVRQVGKQGFLLSARNATYELGYAGFNWLAVHQRNIGSGIKNFPLLDVRLGVTQPHSFGAHVDPNGFLPIMYRSDWMIKFSRSLTTFPPDSFPISLTSAASHGESYYALEAPFNGGPNLNKYDVTRTVAAFGLVINENAIKQHTIHIQGGNSDTVFGKCAFNWASCALYPRDHDYHPAFPDMIVDSGATYQPVQFAATNNFGDWQSWEVYFERPFATPPVVFVTATDRGTQGISNPAVQGIVADVTPYGFSIAARNSDSVGGEVNFYWLAFGCGEGCG